MSITYSIESPDISIQSFGEKIGMSSNGNIVVTHHGDSIYIYNIDDRSNIILEQTIELSNISTINEVAVNEDGNLIIIAYNLGTDTNQRILQITNKSDLSSVEINDGTNWQIIGSNIYYVNSNGLQRYNNALQLINPGNSSITDYSIISEDIFVYVKDGVIYDKDDNQINLDDTDTTSITKVAIKEKKDDSNGYYIVYSRESSVYIKDNDLNNYNSIAINNIKDIDISNGGNKVMIIFEESIDNFKVRKYEYDSNNEWVEIYEYSGGENYIRISDDGYTTIWSSENNNIEFTKAYFYQDFTITVNVEGRDDPLGITDSNVEVEINEDESLQIYIDSYLDFYLVDTDDTIRYGIDTNYGLNLGNVILDDNFETNGQLTYTPYENVSGTDRIKILGIDSSGNETVGMLSITINAVDDSATGGISLSGDFLPNTLVTVTNTIEDIDDDEGSYSFSYTYLLDDNVIEEDSLESTFLLPDNNNSNKITVRLNVIYSDDTSKNTSFTAEAIINEFRLITSNSISDTNILEDGIYLYDLTTIANSNAVMSSDNVEFEIIQDVQDGTANIDSNRVLTVVPNENYNGPISIVVKARTDTNITSITEDITFDLIVQNVNDSPYFYNTIYINNATHNTEVTINLQTMVKDDDEDTLTFSVDSENGPQYGTVEFDGYIMKYTANENYSETSDSYNIIASDNNGGTGVGTVEVSIEIPDTPPVFNGDSNYVFQQGEEINFILPFTDDGFFEITIDDSTPLPSFLQLNNKTIETKEDTTNDDVGEYSFTVIANDGNNLPVSQQITLTINDVNDVPIFEGDFSEKTIFPNSLYEKTVRIYDVDGQNITVIVDGPTWLSYQITSNKTDTSDMSDVNVQFSGTPTRDDGGTTTITITAEDENDSSVRTIATYDLTVYVEENNPPVFSGDSNYVFQQGEDINFILPFTDDGFFEVTIDTNEPLPSFLRLNNKTIETKEETTNDDVGQYSFTVIASDEYNTVSQQITLTIEDVNDTPIFEGDFSNETILPNTTYEKTIRVYDVDGQNITVTVDGPSWLIYEITSNQSDTSDMSDINVKLSGDPSDNDGGKTTITITAEDENDSNIRTIASYDLTVLVEPNESPIFTGDSQTSFNFNQGEDIEIIVSFSDADGDNVGVSFENLPDFLQYDAINSKIYGTTTNDNVGMYDNITIIGNDGNGGIATKIIDITINDVNDTPEFAGDVGSDSQIIVFPGDELNKDIVVKDIDGDNIILEYEGLPDWINVNMISNNSQDTNDMSDITIELRGEATSSDGGSSSVKITAIDGKDNTIKNELSFQLMVIGVTTGIDNSNLVGIICFLEGAKILTDEGYKRIETLERGSMIKTCNNGYIPIKYIGYSKFNNPCHDGRIKHRLYEYEDKNLVLTGCHSVLKKNLTKEQKYKIKDNYDNIFLTDGYYRLPAFLDESNKPYRKGGIQKIYHIALESCNINMNYGIYANDLLVESCAIYDFDYYCVTKI